MKGAKEQAQHAIKEMSEYLINGTKRQIDFTKRNIPKFEKWLNLLMISYEENNFRIRILSKLII